MFPLVSIVVRPGVVQCDLKCSDLFDNHVMSMLILVFTNDYKLNEANCSNWESIDIRKSSLYAHF